MLRQIVGMNVCWIKPREHARVGLVPSLHGIFSLRLCLRAPYLTNAVFIISVSQALIRTTRRPPKAEDGLCRFYWGFFRTRLTLSSSSADNNVEVTKSSTNPQINRKNTVTHLCNIILLITLIFTLGFCI